VTSFVGNLRRRENETTTNSRNIRRQSIPEDVASALRQRILSGEFQEGRQLRQEAIAKEYDVSRMPVREALRLLEADGLVAMQTHRGAVVTAHSPKEIGQLFDLRTLLEKDVLSRAVALATPADIARTEAILLRLEAAYRQKNVHAWGVLNSEFHHSLYLPADGQLTLDILKGINSLIERYIRLDMRLSLTFERAIREHRKILRLYRQGKTRDVVKLLERHIQGTKQELLQAMDKRIKQFSKERAR
jgi:DNA-binding GntR family transcriptional regulator